jgi:hypothetical protein
MFDVWTDGSFNQCWLARGRHDPPRVERYVIEQNAPGPF